jgi:hypothetical protein
MPLLDPGKVYRLDTSLEDAITELVEALDPASPECALLAELVGRQKDLGEQLLDLLGLPEDDAWRVAGELLTRLGAEKLQAAIAWLARELSRRGAPLSASHVAVLTRQSGGTTDGSQ